MKKFSELKEVSTKENETRAYAAIVKRGTKWTSPEAVARMSGLSTAASTSALWNLKRAGIARWKWQGKPGAFRVTRRGASVRRAELDSEARRLRLIGGPWMKPLFVNVK